MVSARAPTTAKYTSIDDFIPPESQWMIQNYSWRRLFCEHFMGLYGRLGTEPNASASVATQTPIQLRAKFVV